MASSCARSLSRSVFKSIEKLKRELGVLIDAIHVARPHVKKVTSIRTISEVTDVHLGHDELISRFTDSR